MHFDFNFLTFDFEIGIFRVYVLLTSLDPLRAYIYDEGLGNLFILKHSFLAEKRDP